MRKILVVDDDDLLCELARIKLAMFRYKVTTAYDGKSALAALKSDIPDIIILDQMMPVMSGGEFLLQIKSNPRYAHIPVIMLSLRSAPTDIAIAKSQGAVDYFTKPFVPDALVARIEEILRPHPDANQSLRKVIMTLGVPMACIASPAAAQEAASPFQQALTAHEDGDHGVAAKQMRELVKAEPGDADNWLRLGLELSHLNDFEGATAALKQALVLAPDYPDAKQALQDVAVWQAAIVAPQAPSQKVAGPDISPRDAETNSTAQWAIAANQSHSWFSKSIQPDWQDSMAVVSYRPKPNATYLAQVEVNKRFGLKDVLLSAHANWRLTPNVSAYLGGAKAVKPDFRERWSIQAGGSARVTKSLEFSFDSRVADYGTAKVKSATPRMSVTLPAVHATVTGGWINVWNEAGVRQSGWSLRGDLQPSEKINFYLGAAKYPDTEAGVTRQTKARFIGLAYSLKPDLRLSAGYDTEQRIFGAKRNSLTLGLRWTIDHRRR